MTMFDPAQCALAQVLSTYNIDIDEQYFSIINNTKELVNDTRELNVNDIFCAIIGELQDGRDYINKAIGAGATAVIAECSEKASHGQLNIRTVADKTALVIQFYQLNYHLFDLCQRYYQCPQQEMTMIGVTGTNGKTSTCQIIAKLLEADHQSCAVIGTLGAGKIGALSTLINTTPGATELHHYLNSFKAQNEKNVAMEVSSHALSQRRITADIIDIAVFTNLSRDHLDFHKTMAAYSAVKKTIFTENEDQIAIVNGDDDIAKQWLASWSNKQPIIVYSRDEASKAEQYSQYVVAKKIQLSGQGASFDLVTHVGNQRVVSALLGNFNIDNLLAAIAVLIAKQVSFEKICQAIAQLTPVSGRMESFSYSQLPTAVVDYAHTPDALEKALIACRTHCAGELWVVFGCGGDRDVGKRSLMGGVAENNADHVIVTNDNPRNEVPELIVQDIMSGCQHPEKITIMLDRQQAVLTALRSAKKHDVVLLAGKGHENNIIIADKKIAYNEINVTKNFCNQAICQFNKNNNEVNS